MFRSAYYKDTVPEHFKKLCETVLKPYSGTRHFDKVFVNSASNAHDISSLQTIDYRELHIIEEGAYDYNEHLWNETLRSGCYHSMNIDRVWQKEMYRHIERVNWNDSVINKYLKLFEGVKMCDVDIIVYTDPLDNDFGVLDYKERVINYLENNFPHSHIMVKRHPRDCNTYTSGIVTLDVCDDLIPAQVLGRFDCTQFYFYPSTGLFYIEDTLKIYFVQFKELYREVNEFTTRDIL